MPGPPFLTLSQIMLTDWSRTMLSITALRAPTWVLGISLPDDVLVLPHTGLQGCGYLGKQSREAPPPACYSWDPSGALSAPMSAPPQCDLI